MNEFDPGKKYEYRSQGWADERGGRFRPVTAADVSVGERVAFIRKVYALFFAGTLFGVGGALLGFMYPPLMLAFAAHPWIAFFLMIGGVMGAQAVRHKPGINLVALFGFTTFTGLVISPLLYFISRQNPVSIFQAGALTVGIFGGLTVYVFVSDRDFSFMRGMLVVGLVVVILGGLLNIFMVGSSALAFGLAVAALLVFSGFVLYDTSNIIRRYPTNEYIAGALSLYLDAFNMFLALLRILNAGRR
jgi:FtsH-binding integral membrane protein